MGTDRFWIALVDVRPNASDNTDWLEYFGENAAGGFVHVMGLARSPERFQQSIQAELQGRNWTAHSFDDLELLSTVKAREPLSSAFEALERELLRTGELQFGRFYLYPADQADPSDWLSSEGGDERLSRTQRIVLSNLAGMLRSLPLPGLGEGIGLTGQGTDELEIHLPHREPAELDVTILVRMDEEITVDYEYGHLHFLQREGEEWVDEALEFIYSSLQGGIRVEIWAVGDKLSHSRASILLENGEWFAFPMWSASLSPPAAEAPTETKLLSFLDTS